MVPPLQPPSVASDSRVFDQFAHEVDALSRQVSSDPGALDKRQRLLIAAINTVRTAGLPALVAGMYDLILTDATMWRATRFNRAWVRVDQLVLRRYLEMSSAERAQFMQELKELAARALDAYQCIRGQSGTRSVGPRHASCGAATVGVLLLALVATFGHPVVRAWVDSTTAEHDPSTPRGGAASSAEEITRSTRPRRKKNPLSSGADASRTAEECQPRGRRVGS